MRLIIILVLCIAGYIGYWRLRRTGDKLVKLTTNVKDNPSNQTVREYIHVLQRTKVPEDDAFWGILREAYEVICRQDNAIENDLKEQFRLCLVNKGAKWANVQ